MTTIILFKLLFQLAIVFNIDNVKKESSKIKRKIEEIIITADGSHIKKMIDPRRVPLPLPFPLLASYSFLQYPCPYSRK